MLSLTKLELVNFQKHSKLCLEFTNNVNVISGTSDSGKSAIRRSIEFLCGWHVCSGLKKQGTKQTSVKGYFSNGVILTRIRSTSINRYILEINGNEKIFDAIGRTVPNEIIEVLGIEPVIVSDEKFYLNSYPQISMPFLFNLSATDRMKLFNRLSGNEILDKLFVQLNKDILGNNKELKDSKEKHEKLTIDLSVKEDRVKQLSEKFKKAEKDISELEQKCTKRDKLLELKNLYNATYNNIQSINNAISNIKIPQDIDTKELTLKIERLNSLKTLQNASEINDASLNRVRQQLAKTSEIGSIKMADLTLKIERFQKLASLLTNIKENGILIEQRGKELKLRNEEYKNLEKQKIQLFSEMKLCPLCNQEINHVST